MQVLCIGRGLARPAILGAGRAWGQPLVRPESGRGTSCPRSLRLWCRSCPPGCCSRRMVPFHLARTSSPGGGPACRPRWQQRHQVLSACTSMHGVPHEPASAAEEPFEGLHVLRQWGQLRPGRSCVLLPPAFSPGEAEGSLSPSLCDDQSSLAVDPDGPVPSSRSSLLEVRQPRRLVHSSPLLRPDRNPSPAAVTTSPQPCPRACTRPRPCPCPCLRPCPWFLSRSCVRPADCTWNKDQPKHGLAGCRPPAVPAVPALFAVHLVQPAGLCRKSTFLGPGL